MKKRITFLSMISLVLLSSASEITNEAKSQLTESFQKIYDEKNLEDFTKLFYLDGLSSSAKRNINFSARFLYKQKILRVYLSDEIPERMKGESESNGKTFAYNLKPLGCLIAEVPNPRDPNKVGSTPFVYGEKDGRLYLLQRTEKGRSWTGPDDVGLGVVIMSQTSTKQPMLKGYIIYNKSGVDKKITFEKEGGYSWNFYGQYIKEVVIDKLDDNGTTRLELIKKTGPEEFTTTYKSESVKEKSQIVYKRKK